MTELSDPLDIEGPAAPPRDNGELVFTAPWQSRLFATTMRLREQGLIEWEPFRQGLIANIAEHEKAIDEPGDYDYWGCWQRALEGLLGRLDVVAPAEIDATSAEIAARPPDH